MIGDILPNVMLECGIDRTAPQINGTDYEMSQIRALMNAAGRDIHTRTEWGGAMKDTALSAGMSTSLPSDFQEMAESGAIKLAGSAYRPARPVVDPTMWQMLAGRPSAQPYYHIYGGSVHVAAMPAPTGGTIRYVSKNWLVGNKAAITVNTDVPVFPEHLLERGTIWRFRRQKGLPYEDVRTEFEADLAAAIMADRGA